MSGARLYRLYAWNLFDDERWEAVFGYVSADLEYMKRRADRFAASQGFTVRVADNMDNDTAHPFYEVKGTNK